MAQAVTQCGRSGLLPALRVGAVVAGVAYGSMRYSYVSSKVSAQQAAEEAEAARQVASLRARIAELEGPKQGAEVFVVFVRSTSAFCRCFLDALFHAIFVHRSSYSALCVPC